MHTPPRARLAALLLAASPAFALADDRTYTIDVPDPVATFDERQPAPAASFGDKGSQWWTVGGGVAYNFAHATDWNIRGAWSYFVIKDVEFSLELNGWYFDQPGDNAPNHVGRRDRRRR